MRTSLPSPKGPLPNFRHVCCGQTAGWIKMALGMEVRGPWCRPHCVRWGTSSTPPKRGQSPPPIFGPFLASRSCLVYAIARPSVCMYVTFVRPTQAVQIFGNISTALGTLATRSRHSLKISRRSSQGNPSAWGVKHKRGSQV